MSGGNSFKIRFVDTNNMYTISKSKGVEEYKKEEVLIEGKEIFEVFV